MSNQDFQDRTEQPGGHDSQDSHDRWDTQNGTIKTGKVKRNRTRHAEGERENRPLQAEQDRQNRIGRTGQTEHDIIHAVKENCEFLAISVFSLFVRRAR
jgi:hypothetical protein